MSMIHWLGAGLSSHPGIRRLASKQLALTVWNRTIDKAIQALDGIDHNALTKQLDLDNLQQTLGEHISDGDIVVSMLPATQHITIATLCLEKNAHFISSSYISPEMQALHAQAKSKNLCFVNETGLDPGLDHLFAHALIDRYKTSPVYDARNIHRFRSYCGGFPKTPNDFKYKFSWSPLGVLRALKSPAQWIANSETKSTHKPWKALSQYEAKLQSGAETFQAYPNRDSIPFMQQYDFDQDWQIDEFIRGTLRLDGWAQAWQVIFDTVDDPEKSKDLETLSQSLWKQYAYDNGEPDRVVLNVELEVLKNNETIWHQSYSIDTSGNDDGSAMARLVSYPVSLAIESVLNKQIPSGVSAAPKAHKTVEQWLATLTDLGEPIHKQQFI